MPTTTPIAGKAGTGAACTCGASAGGSGNPEQYDLLEDTLQNTEMVVFWSSDPEANTGIYSAHESTPAGTG